MAGIQNGQKGMNPGSVSNHPRQLGASYPGVVVSVPNVDGVPAINERGCIVEQIAVDPLGLPGATSLL